MKVRPRLLVFAGVASLVGLSLFLPPVQDYREYLAQWRLVMDGHSPWFDLGENHTNTYGAAHILFAPVAWLAWPLPRFLTTLAGIFIGWQLFRSTPEGAPCTIIGHNAGRISKFLSIFRFLRAETLPLGSSLRPWSLPLILISQTLLFLRYRTARHNSDPLASTVLALLALFALYPVGHAQFYFPVFVLLLLLHARGLPGIRMGCFIGWISGITLSDHLVTLSGGSNLLIREYAGLPTFIVALALAHELYRETSPTGTARGSSGEPARGSNST